MIKKLLRAGKFLAQPKLFRALQDLTCAGGYLWELGWVHSFQNKRPIDNKNNVLPWYTYPFIKFLKDRLNNTMDVFEYGCGNSTMWFASKVRTVTSVENDKGWFDIVASSTETVYPNINIEYSQVGDGYCEAITRHPCNFDLIIIDGRDRVNCTKYALSKLKADGVVIFDNSDRAEYKDAYDLLEGAGFRRIDFWGMGPINNYEWCTSVFYRRDNVFGI